jgi:hypothetical protein
MSSFRDAIVAVDGNLANSGGDGCESGRNPLSRRAIFSRGACLHRARSRDLKHSAWATGMIHVIREKELTARETDWSLRKKRHSVTQPRRFESSATAAGAREHCESERTSSDPGPGMRGWRCRARILEEGVALSSALRLMFAGCCTITQDVFTTETQRYRGIEFKRQNASGFVF